MKYNFIKFERDYLKGDAKISISRASALRFSAKFCKITNIMDFEYVIIYYDSKNKAIGILPTNKQEKGSFKITKEKTSASISISSFLSTHELNPKIYHGRYDWSKESIHSVGEMFVIVLKKKNENETNT